MLAGRAVHADAARAVQHLPVAADVDAAGVGRGGQRDVAGADVAAAVAGPEFRRREIAVRSMSSPRSTTSFTGAFDFGMRTGAILPVHDGAGFLDHLRDGKIGIEADRQRVTLLARAQHVGEHARAGLVAGDVLEQQRRSLLGARRHVGDGGEFLVGVDGLADALKLAVALDQRDPFAQIAPADLWGVLGGRGRGGTSAMRCSMRRA